jgi:hypothetical protein
MEAGAPDRATATVVERLTAAARSLLSGRRVILAHTPVAGAVTTSGRASEACSSRRLSIRFAAFSIMLTQVLQ